MLLLGANFSKMLFEGTLYRVVVSLLRLRAEHGSAEQTEELTRDMNRVALGYLNESGLKET